jgi:hypothetical protein
MPPVIGDRDWRVQFRAAGIRGIPLTNAQITSNAS